MPNWLMAPRWKRVGTVTTVPSGLDILRLRFLEDMVIVAPVRLENECIPRGVSGAVPVSSLLEAVAIVAPVCFENTCVPRGASGAVPAASAGSSRKAARTVRGLLAKQ